jgi:hypothetical protein
VCSLSHAVLAFIHAPHLAELSTKCVTYAQCCHCCCRRGGNAFHPYAKRLGDIIYKEMPKVRAATAAASTALHWADGRSVPDLFLPWLQLQKDACLLGRTYNSQHHKSVKLPA